MSNQDKLMLSLPAVAGGIPILLNIYASITVLFLVIGFYLGTSASVEDKDSATAFAALGGILVLGGFVVQQWVKYQWKSLRYQSELTDNVYYRNINNNAGIFDYLIGAAEDQECKEAFLTYYFLHTADTPLTTDELDGRIEAWLRKTFGVEVHFAVNGALSKLEGLGLLRRQQERLFVSPLDGALAPITNCMGSIFKFRAASRGQMTENQLGSPRLPRPNSSRFARCILRPLCDIDLIASGEGRQRDFVAG
jgi:hypothetical protein